jgi:hypothetical protein
MATGKIQLGLPQFPEGVPPELFQVFYQVFSAIHNLSRYVSQYAGIDPEPSDIWSQLAFDDSVYSQNLNRVYMRADEAIPFGALVSPIVVGTEIRMRLANATNNTRWALGACSTESGVLLGSFGEFIIGHGMLFGISGLIAGSRYWVHTTAGQVVNAAPVAAGNIEQSAGVALTSGRFFMNLNFGFIQH